jgi:glycosyltransferase involved in cell wall biosynthesis
MRPYLQEATIAASPITYGAGIQNKVLEAMACGTPVIVTKQAVSALEVKPGDDVIIADDHVSFAREVLNLLDNPDRRKRLGGAGRIYVERNHDWSVVAANLENVYLSMLKKVRFGARVN